MYDNDVFDMQADHFLRWKSMRRWTIVQENDGLWSVHQHTIDSVTPTTKYVTKEEAAARLLQLMDIADPVTPQSWPERVRIEAPRHD